MSFYKFPSTPHLAILGDNRIRSDKVMSEKECRDFLHKEIIIEEKVDGANLGISFDASGNLRLQNRGSYLQDPLLGQWRKVTDWLTPHLNSFFEILQDRYILFGEWCYARHTVFYDRLPDWFLGFDVFCKVNKKFFSIARRDALFRNIGIVSVPFVARGVFSYEKLSSMLKASTLGNVDAEGLYMRYDEGLWLAKRAKLVRPEFIQTIEEHWSDKGIEPNKLLL